MAFKALLPILAKPQVLTKTKSHAGKTNALSAEEKAAFSRLKCRSPISQKGGRNKREKCLLKVPGSSQLGLSQASERRNRWRRTDTWARACSWALIRGSCIFAVFSFLLFWLIIFYLYFLIYLLYFFNYWGFAKIGNNALKAKK